MNYDELNRIWGDDFHEGAEEIDDIDGCYHLLLDPKLLRVSGDFVYELSADGGAVIITLADQSLQRVTIPDILDGYRKLNDRFKRQLRERCGDEIAARPIKGGEFQS